MKFGVLLRTSAADVPELQALYSCYKVLKKRLKQLPERGQAGAPDGAGTAAGASSLLEEREAAFVQTLNEDVQTFNDLFMEVCPLNCLSRHCTQTARSVSASTTSIGRRRATTCSELLADSRQACLTCCAVEARGCV